MTRAQDILTRLSTKDMESLKAYTKVQHLTPGTVIVEQGSTDRDLFIVLTGTAKVYQKLMLATNTCALETATLEAPFILGESNLLLQQTRNASVMTTDSTILLRLSHEDLTRMQEQNPALAIKILCFAGETLAERFIHTRDNIQSNVLAQAEDVRQAMGLFSTYIGKVKPCSPEVAAKLFGI